MALIGSLLGHSSPAVTGRYSHLRPELFRESDYLVFDIDMEPAGELVQLGRERRAADGLEVGCSLAAEPDGDEVAAVVNS